jgi:hypothetical protein
MNHESKPTLTIAVHGQLTIGRSDLERLLRELNFLHAEANRPVAIKPEPLSQGTGAGVPGLAYPMRETAEILGVH